MAYIPKMDQTGPVVALIAAVLDGRDGGTEEYAREVGYRVGQAMSEDLADFVTTSAFVGAALAELAAEALGTQPEEVLAIVVEAGSTGDDQTWVGDEEG